MPLKLFAGYVRNFAQLAQKSMAGSVAVVSASEQLKNSKP